MGETDPDDNQRHLYLFGTDLSTMPCFRSSFLYGISGGIGAGIAVFMGTSRPQFSTHCGFGTFMITTLAYWFTCRYQWSKKRFEMAQLEPAMRKQILYEGTAVEEEVNRNFSELK